MWAHYLNYPHCNLWYQNFMRDDSPWSCLSYEREPGSDDEWACPQKAARGQLIRFALG